jgi:hypothetical protein
MPHPPFSTAMVDRRMSPICLFWRGRGMPCSISIFFAYIFASFSTWTFYDKAERLEVAANVEDNIIPHCCLNQVHTQISVPNGQFIAAFCRMPMVSSQSGWA